MKKYKVHLYHIKWMILQKGEVNVNFTYKTYDSFIKLVKESGYTVCDYHDYENYDKRIILRHDIDYCLSKSIEIAQIENDNNVKSTYFILLSSDFYNLSSPKSQTIVKTLLGLGHEIGLHYDELAVSQNAWGGVDILTDIEKERRILSDIIGVEVKSVSMHRPSKRTLEANYQLYNAVNSYSETFLKEFKYLSDSRRNWREPVLDIVRAQSYKSLHILTHPFWYNKIETSAREAIMDFVNNANYNRYFCLKDNIRDISEFMNEDEVK